MAYAPGRWSMLGFFRSMLGRIFLILCIGIFAAVTLTLTIANGARADVIAQMHAVHTAERVQQLVLMLDSVPPEARRAVMLAANRNGLLAFPGAHAPLPGAAYPDLRSALLERLGSQRHINANLASGDSCAITARWPDADVGQREPVCDVVDVDLKDGERIRLLLHPHRDWLSSMTTARRLLELIVFPLSIILLAYIVAHMSTQPLQQLAAAAVRLGQDIDQEPLPERGSTEVRHATSAFNAMQAQIHSHVRERMQMLAAITHDLQTPLTRLRLRVEKVDDVEIRGKLIDDLSAIQHMVREGLDLVRSANGSETCQRVDLDSLLDTVCSDAADAGQDVQYRGHTQLTLTMRPNAMRRCLNNLVDNAVKYGGSARVHASRNQDTVHITVRDSGPGIPEHLLKKVLEPFFRVESSRSRDTGGTGIGLTIARNIAELHSGRLELGNHPEGGLVATVILPYRE